MEGSSIAREADHVLYTKAGPEIAVATTKAFSSQLVLMYLFSVKMAFVKGRIDGDRYRSCIGELQALPDKIARLLTDRSGSSGLPQNSPMQEMFSLSEGGRTMPSVWREA